MKRTRIGQQHVRASMRDRVLCNSPPENHVVGLLMPGERQRAMIPRERTVRLTHEFSPDRDALQIKPLLSLSLSSISFVSRSLSGIATTCVVIAPVGRE